jgi:hypothetical protein
MLVKDAVAYFGSKPKIQKLLGYGNSAVYRWGEIVPESSAGRLFVLSGQAIPYRVEDYVKSDPPELTEETPEPTP